ncbi:MAG TPA: hypothetical protein VHE57_11180 [Mycobacteriales bacterium]|nr:hypothetical protein [Mycobacteriales bacterium]
MTEPSTEERPPSATHDHPPFRMRERRRLLLPDLTPPTLEELRWAARQRRVRREALVPQPRQADSQVLDADWHGAPEQREQAAVAAATEEQVLDEPVVESSASDTIDLVAAEAEAASWPWQPVVLPEPEPVEEPEPSWVSDVRPPGGPTVDVVPLPEVAAVAEAEFEPVPEATVAEELPPLVSQVLVVHEPAPAEPGRIAVLDEVDLDPVTVTRLVPVPVESADTTVDTTTLGEPAVETEYVEELDVAAAQAGAPLYWRVLRLRHTRPNGWLRALYFEGSVALAVVLVLAEAASVWTIVVLPFVVAVVVKANDVLAGSLRRTYRQPGPNRARR